MYGGCNKPLLPVKHHLLWVVSMMPTPSHLIECVVPKDVAIDETPLAADVCCPCGSQSFDLHYPGQTKEYHGQPIPVTAEIDGRFFFLIKARCSPCGREYLLFDKDFHGWNGFVCHDPTQAALPRPNLIPWECPKCGELKHHATVQIQTEGKLDFIEENEGMFDEDRWPDAFGWISIAITCSGCGKQTPEWVSYETM